jgi:hypothetical protein
MDRGRFDINLLDPDDPFEIDDGNRPHLYKHLPVVAGKPITVGVEDLYDVYTFGNPLFYPAREDGAADWLMIGKVPGLILVVPLAPPSTFNPAQCRPIGLYTATDRERRRYFDDLETGENT